MLRGLLVRQGFMALQALLGAALILIAVSAMRDLMASPTIDNGDMGEIEVGALSLNDPVEDRAYYNSIVKSNLFGQAGKFAAIRTAKPEESKPVTPVDGPPVETKLNLVLKGTLVAGKTSPFSSATILIKEKNIGQKSFFIGDEVIDKVFLRKISKKEVHIENMRIASGRMEVLKHKLEFGNNGSVPVAVTRTSSDASSGKPAEKRFLRTSSQKVRRTASTIVTLDRKDIVEKLNRDYEKLASTMDVIEEKDAQGKLLGLSTPDIESIPVAKELGFKNGDVLTSINGEKVTSQDQVASLANKYQNAGVVRIGFLRGGNAMTTTYRLR